MLKNELAYFKKAYLITLQSCLNVDQSDLFSAFSNVGASYLFGRQKETIKLFINEGRNKDSTIPKWEALDSCAKASGNSFYGDDYFVDLYGFKYEKRNETSALNYLCEKLIAFYDNESKLVQENFWSMKIKEWETIPSIDTKSKSYIRKGIASSYRSKVWKFAINKQVETIKITKGANYFEHLCQLSTESNVIIVYFY